MRYSYDWYLNKNREERWCYHEHLFTPDECKKIINYMNTDLEKQDGGVIDPDLPIDKKLRSSKISFIPANLKENNWIFERITSSVIELNNLFFKYDIEKIESLQFTEYKQEYNGFYDKHIDNMYDSIGFRKLSFSVNLSDPDTYDGGKLLFHIGGPPSSALSTIGTLNLFPSYTLHEVTPVTQGTRYSLVGWVWGPRFR